MPAGIKFSCPHCGRTCKVPLELAGRQGRCPGCRKGLEVPLVSELSSDQHDLIPSEGEPEPEPEPEESDSHIETTTLRPKCPGCKLELPNPHKIDECPYCHTALRTKKAGSPPWQVIVALLLFIPAPLPGLIFAQLGLKAARRKNSHENLAWVAVVLNVVFVLIGMAWWIREMSA